VSALPPGFEKKWYDWYSQWRMVDSINEMVMFSDSRKDKVRSTRRRLNGGIIRNYNSAYH
jgi:hypothetical protein